MHSSLPTHKEQSDPIPQHQQPVIVTSVTTADRLNTSNSTPSNGIPQQVLSPTSCCRKDRNVSWPQNTAGERILPITLKNEARSSALDVKLK